MKNFQGAKNNPYLDTMQNQSYDRFLKVFDMRTLRELPPVALSLPNVRGVSYFPSLTSYDNENPYDLSRAKLLTFPTFDASGFTIEICGVAPDGESQVQRCIIDVPFSVESDSVSVILS